MFLDPLERGRSLLSRASKIIKIEWLTKKLWSQTCSVEKSIARIHKVFFFFSGCSFSIAGIGFSLNFYWFPSENNQKHVFVCKKKTLWIRVELFALLYVWHHNFFVSHSILMILDAQKSRDHPLSNGSKNINFRRGKIFFRTRWTKWAFNYGTQFTNEAAVVLA